MSFMDWYEPLAVGLSTTIVVLPIGFIWGVRVFYPQYKRAQRDLDSANAFLRAEQQRRLDAEISRDVASIMREFHAKEATCYFEADLKQKARIVKLEEELRETQKLLHGTEEALRFQEQQATIENARKTNASQP